MAARTIPTLPTWTAGRRVTGASLAAMVSYQSFWANPPMFRAYQAVAQSIPNTTDTQITLDTKDYDTDSAWSSSTPYNITIPTGLGGRWTFTWSAATAINATGARISYLKKNGTRISGETVGAAPGNDISQAFGTVTVAVTAGDVIGLWLWQNSGGALNTSANANSMSSLEGRLISLASP